MIYAVVYDNIARPRVKDNRYEADKLYYEWQRIPEHEKHIYSEPIALLKIKLKPDTL